MTKRNQLLSLALVSVTFLVFCLPTSGSQSETTSESSADEAIEMPTWLFAVPIVVILLATQIIGISYERHFYPSLNLVTLAYLRGRS